MIQPVASAAHFSARTEAKKENTPIANVKNPINLIKNRRIPSFLYGQPGGLVFRAKRIHS
jgi:hypothetical protein